MKLQRKIKQNSHNLCRADRGEMSLLFQTFELRTSEWGTWPRTLLSSFVLSPFSFFFTFRFRLTASHNRERSLDEWPESSQARRCGINCTLRPVLFPPPRSATPLGKQTNSSELVRENTPHLNSLPPDKIALLQPAHDLAGDRWVALHYSKLRESLEWWLFGPAWQAQWFLTPYTQPWYYGQPQGGVLGKNMRAGLKGEPDPFQGGSTTICRNHLNHV